MPDVDSFLSEWSVRFLENKDYIKRSIGKVEKKGNSEFIIHYKDKIKRFFIRLSLDAGIFDKIKGTEHVGIITLNNEENIKFLCTNWTKLSSFKFLSIYFTNPFSSRDKAWILLPHVHNSICGRDSLETGLKSMSEMIEKIDEVKLKQNIKLKKE